MIVPVSTFVASARRSRRRTSVSARRPATREIAQAARHNPATWTSAISVDPDGTCTSAGCHGDLGARFSGHSYHFDHAVSDGDVRGLLRDRSAAELAAPPARARLERLH